MAAIDIELNLDGFHVTSLISDYKGTLYDIEFNPKEKYTDLYKFLAELRMHVHINLIECLCKTPALRVFFSVDLESGLDCHPATKFETVNTPARYIYEACDVEEIVERLFNDVVKSYYGWKQHLPQLKINSILAANMHIVAATDHYAMFIIKSLEIVQRNTRFGHKFRAELASRNCRGMYLSYVNFLILILHKHFPI